MIVVRTSSRFTSKRYHGPSLDAETGSLTYSLHHRDTSTATEADAMQMPRSIHEICRPRVPLTTP